MSKYQICKEIVECLEWGDATYDNPMPIWQVAEYVGISESNKSCPKTRKLVKEAMKFFNIPIGTNRKGFYIIQTAQEMQRYLNSLLKRQIGITETIDICYEAFHGRHGK